MKCAACGGEKIAAKILGRYYCYECGSKLVKEHIARLLEEFERREVMKAR